MARKVVIQNKETSNSKEVDTTKSIFTQVRIDEDTFLKGKILAAIFDESFNSLMIRAIREQIKAYESENGPLPKPMKPSE